MSKKSIILFILTILWMLFIFTMSSMPEDMSNKQSKGVVNRIVKVDDINKSNKSNNSSSNEDKEKIIDELNKPVRKCAHAFEYLVLFILVVSLIGSIRNKPSKYYLSLLICFLYASTDEFHQLFVVGRSGQFKDVLIDTLGAFIGLVIYLCISKIRNKKTFE